MQFEYPRLPFERYADDAIVHCRTEREAEEVRNAIPRRAVRAPSGFNAPVHGTTERGGNEEIRKRSSQQIPKLWRLELALRVERWVVADYENTIEQNQLRLLYPSGSVNVTRDLEWR
jgi:hypothetical protein